MNLSRTLVKRGGALLMKPLKHNRMPETSSCNNSNSNTNIGEGVISQTDESRCKAMEEEEEEEDQMTTCLDGCGSNFDCNICLESSRDPVVTVCGHLFCWACLYKWLNSSSHHGIQQCPVCKASVKDKIIPLYGRGKVVYASNTANGRKEGNETVSNSINIPSRPSAPRSIVSMATRHRTPQQFSSFYNHGMGFHDAHPSLGGGNVPLSASFGLFPALFGFQLGGFPEYNHSFSYNGSSSVGAPDARANPNAMVIQQRMRWNNSQQEFLLHWVFIVLVFFVVGCFLFF